MYIHCTVTDKVLVNLNLFLRQFIRTFSFKPDIHMSFMLDRTKNAYRYNIILMFLWINIRRLLDIILKDETCDLRARGDVRYNL